MEISAAFWKKSAHANIFYARIFWKKRYNSGSKVSPERVAGAERFLHHNIITIMQYTHEVEQMCCVKKGCNHGPAPIPQEGAWTQSTKIEDISGLTHGVGWCAPQQGACKLTLNVKQGIIQEALVETIGCSGMTHSAAMASEILPGKTVLEALNTDLVCDAINTAMRELFLQIVYGRTQSAYSEGGLPIGAGLEDLGKGLRSQTGTDGQTALRVSTLGASVNNLQEKFAHGGVDGIAHEVGVQSLEHGLAGQDFRSHGGGVGHAGAADGFDEGFLDDALLHIEGQLASTLLRSAPTHTVGKAGDVLNLGGLRPGTLLGDGGGAVIAALLDATHLFDFVCVLHNV